MYGLGIRERREGVREREREAESGYNARCSRCFCTDEKGTAKERERERGDIYMGAEEFFSRLFDVRTFGAEQKEPMCARILRIYLSIFLLL